MSEFKDMVLSNMLDGLSYRLHQKVVQERRGQCTSTAKRGGSRASSKAMEMPWLQSTKRRTAFFIYLLVRERARSKDNRRASASLMRSNLRPRADIPQKVSPPMRPNLSFWTVPTMLADKSYPELFLWQIIGN